MIVALNLKSNLLKEEYDKYFSEMNKLNPEDLVIVCPPSIYLNKKYDNLKLGSQNVSKYDLGAHTGEVTSSQLKSFGVTYSIVGHSERRADGETDEDINKKILRLQEEGITPILCVGETKEERDKGTYQKVITNMLGKDLVGVNFNNIIMAYEPVWAIGSGITPTNEEIKEVAEIIKNIIPSKVLYGGSVKLSNINELESISVIDGYLIGGLSLEIDNIKKVIK